jgi:hypothetical protein
LINGKIKVGRLGKNKRNNLKEYADRCSHVKHRGI